MKRKLKNIAFIIIINATILSVIEVLLFLFGVGYKSSLLYKAEIDGNEYLYFNKLYTYQYFSTSNYSIPAPNHYLFRATKPDSIFRIYVIGESTSKGFPYSKTEAFPFQLEQMLNRNNMGKSFEVINFSMDATNSFTGVDISHEASKYPPDLVILYYGHNEFIGIGGSGGFHNPLFRINKFLSQFRFYQLMKGLISKNKPKDDTALIERMARKPGAIYGSDEYLKTIEDFRNNYESIIQLWNDKNIPVVACGVVRNLKDFRPSQTRVDKEFVSKVIKEIDTGENIDLKNRLDKIAGLRADYHYTIGKALLMENNTDLAYHYFTKACDLDVLRLRAPSDINHIIKELCKTDLCTFIDLQDLIDKSDSSGIAGDNQILEHVHLTLAGHTLIARRLATLVAENYFPETKFDNFSNPALYSSIVDQIALTRILTNLYTKYPLSELNYFNPTGYQTLFTNTSSLKKMTLKPDINRAMYDELSRLFDSYSEIDHIHLAYGMQLYQRNKYNEAYQEFLIAYQINPLNVIALNNMAVIRFMGGDKTNAMKMIENVCKQEENYITGHINLWLMYKYSNRLKDAETIKKKLEQMDADLSGTKSFIMEQI